MKNDNLKRLVEQGKVIFSTELKNVRLSKELAQKDIAEMLDVPVSTYANWEQGRRTPNVGEIFKILKVLDVSADELFDTGKL